jgi:hypothetical protein
VPPDQLWLELVDHGLLPLIDRLGPEKAARFDELVEHMALVRSFGDVPEDLRHLIGVVGPVDEPLSTAAARAWASELDDLFREATGAGVDDVARTFTETVERMTTTDRKDT